MILTPTPRPTSPQQSHLPTTRDDSPSLPPPTPRYHNKIIYPQLGMIFTPTPGMVHSRPQPHASPPNIVIHPQLGMILFHLALLSPALAPLM